MLYDPNNLGAAVTAIGALGTTAAGLVDAMKTSQGLGISNLGFGFVKRAIGSFLVQQDLEPADDAVQRLYRALHGNWINGVKLEDQKAIAKTMIAQLPQKSGSAPGGGAPVAPDDVNARLRFDTALGAFLDDGYQHADQRYRNGSKVAAMIVAIALAQLGAIAMNKGVALTSQEELQALITGLLATPLAPISKDLASALAAGVKVAQSAKGTP